MWLLLWRCSIINCRWTSTSPSVALQKRQKDLSSLLEAALWDQHLASVSPMAKAGLLSEAEPGARAFLTAVPCGRTRMEPGHFVSELRARLGVPNAHEEAWCPRYDAVLDRHSVHASVCVAGGERTQRHNTLRDLIGTWAERPGLHPEKERPGFMLPKRLMTFVQPGEGRLTCTCLLSMGDRPHLISPSRRPSGWMSCWTLRVVEVRPLLPTLIWSAATWIPPLSANSMGWRLSHLWSKSAAHGRRKLGSSYSSSLALPLCDMEALVSLRARPPSWKRHRFLFVLGVLGPLCAVELSWPPELDHFFKPACFILRTILALGEYPWLHSRRREFLWRSGRRGRAPVLTSNFKLYFPIRTRFLHGTLFSLGGCWVR